jgi:hypothetical protein
MSVSFYWWNPLYSRVPLLNVWQFWVLRLQILSPCDVTRSWYAVHCVQKSCYSATRNELSVRSDVRKLSVRLRAESVDVFSNPEAGTRAGDGPGSRAGGECLSTRHKPYDSARTVPFWKIWELFRGTQVQCRLHKFPPPPHWALSWTTWIQSTPLNP